MCLYVLPGALACEMTSQAVHSVCPLPEELAVKGEVTCPVEGCGHRFPSSSHLQMHTVRHHQGRTLESKPRCEAAVFYCPAEGCARSERKGRPFPRLGQLKQVSVLNKVNDPIMRHDRIIRHWYYSKLSHRSASFEARWFIIPSCLIMGSLTLWSGYNLLTINS